MASIENRSGSWRVIFMYKGSRHSFSIGEVSVQDARVAKATTEKLLGLLKQGLIDLRGHTIEDFLRHGGKPPQPEAQAIDYLQSYEDSRPNLGPAVKYEIDVRYSNGDVIHGVFQTKDAAIGFLQRSAE